MELDHPTGLIVYTSSGWMSVQYSSSRDRKPFPKGLAAATDPGLQYIVEGSTDLTAWSTTSNLTELENSALRIVKQYTGSAAKFYFRLKVVKTP